MPTFDTPEPITATIELPIGELRIVATDRPDTVVEVRAEPADQAVADAVRVELVGTELRVTGRKLGLRLLQIPTPGRSVEVEVALPAGSALTARTTYGGIRVEGRLGDVDVRCSYGDVRVEDTGSLKAAAAYGQVHADGIVAGDADVTSDHGGIRLRHVTGSADLRSKHGAIRADVVAGELRLANSHGDVEVDDAAAGVDARTSFGAIRLARVHRGEVSVTSTHGRIDVAVDPDSAVWLEVDTKGRVRNDLTPREGPEGFGEAVTLRARSREGDIVVRRA